jgi:molybdopterin-guanine dinucleotide biosynthesis protein A
MPTAAILAGGRASRFGGQDKRELLVDGRSIFDRQMDALSMVADDIILIGDDDPARLIHGRSAHGIRPRVIRDRVPHSGPLGGLDAALAASKDEALVLLACDMPFVTSELLNYLLALADSADAVVPRDGRGYHPLCAAYTRACQATIARHLVDRRLAMVSLLEEVRVRVVEGAELDAFGSPTRLLVNVNTPDEHAALCRHEP